MIHVQFELPRTGRPQVFLSILVELEDSLIALYQAISLIQRGSEKSNKTLGATRRVWYIVYDTCPIWITQSKKTTGFLIDSGSATRLVNCAIASYILDSKRKWKSNKAIGATSIGGYIVYDTCSIWITQSRKTAGFIMDSCRARGVLNYTIASYILDSKRKWKIKQVFGGYQNRQVHNIWYISNLNYPEQEDRRFSYGFW